MMKNKILIILFALTGLVYSSQMSAQENVVPYGGFEEFIQAGLSEKPKGWVVSRTLSGMKKEDRRPGGSGSYVLHVYTNGGSFSTSDANVPGNVPVEGGKAYRLTFWHKGNKKNIDIKVRFTWYKDEHYRGVSPEALAKTLDGWAQEELYFRVPADTNKGELMFTIDWNDGGEISFDDVEMFLHEGAIPEPLGPPANIKAKTYQREIELTWDRPSDPKITWEVSVNGQIYKDIKTNAFIVDQRDPNRNYVVQIRSVLGEKRSDFSPKVYYKTKPFEKALDSPERTPYIRTIEADGRCQRRIRPYFNDLGSRKAVITYAINGTPAELQEGYLTFPGEGNHRLTVTIDEGNGNKFKLTYRLSILN